MDLSKIAGNMHRLLEPKTLPLARIYHQTITADDVALENLRCIRDGRADRVTPPGTYTSLSTRPLKDDWSFMESGYTLMMSDTPYEMRAASEFKREAKGDVLIFGLGLGATTIPVLQKSNVASVTVVEINPDVIELVAPALRKHLPYNVHRKLHVVQGNAITWKAPKGQLYDTIWADIWPDICGDNLPEMEKLRRRFGRRLNRKANPNAFFGVWEEHWLKRERRLQPRR